MADLLRHTDCYKFPFILNAYYVECHCDVSWDIENRQAECHYADPERHAECHYAG
jgi:hypothetical protein